MSETIDAARDAEQVDVPVVSICGTSAQQGKFTLQLALREALLSRGLRVGQIGTEHHSALFGMDVTFPIGYACPTNLPLRLYPPYIDACVKAVLADEAKDIVLVGTQSGTIPYDVFEPSTYSMGTLPFLMGAKPDVCVLVVNSIDPDAYIQDTIDAIRAVVKCPTVALALSDREKHVRAAYGRSFVTPRSMSDDEIRHHLKRLGSRFDLPTYCITDVPSVGRLADQITEYFQQDQQEEKAEGRVCLPEQPKQQSRIESSV